MIETDGCPYMKESSADHQLINGNLKEKVTPTPQPQIEIERVLCAISELSTLKKNTKRVVLLNLILSNLIVRCPTSAAIENLWNATFGLWKIRIMNGGGGTP